VFRARAIHLDIQIDSAGTGAWHAGEGPDPRSRAEGERRGYSFAGQAARKVRVQDFHDFDYILAMDASNLADLTSIQPVGGKAQLSLFRPDGANVPDPYYGGPDGFKTVVDLIESASDHWMWTDSRQSLNRRVEFDSKGHIFMAANPGLVTVFGASACCRRGRCCYQLSRRFI